MLIMSGSILSFDNKSSTIPISPFSTAKKSAVL